MSEELRDRLARVVEIAVVERTTHHPAKKHWEQLKWLWPLVADALIDHLEADGMVLVPREPTLPMLAAVDDIGLDDDRYVARGIAVSAWTAMLSALPVLGVGR